MRFEAEEVIVKGSLICRGIAIGLPFFLNHDDFIVGKIHTACTYGARNRKISPGFVSQ